MDWAYLIFSLLDDYKKVGDVEDYIWKSETQDVEAPTDIVVRVKLNGKKTWQELKKEHKDLEREELERKVEAKRQELKNFKARESFLPKETWKKIKQVVALSEEAAERELKKIAPYINYTRAKHEYKMNKGDGLDGHHGLYWRMMSDDWIERLSKGDAKGSWRLFVWLITEDTNNPAMLKKIREKFNELHLQDVDEVISSYPMKGDQRIIMLLKKKGKPEEVY